MMSDAPASQQRTPHGAVGVVQPTALHNVPPQSGAQPTQQPPRQQQQPLMKPQPQLNPQVQQQPPMPESEGKTTEQLGQAFQKMAVSKPVAEEKEEEGQLSNANYDESDTNLIINYIPPTMNEGSLATLFSPYGAMENCKIVIDLHTGRSRGYGFVKFKSRADAEKARTALNGYSSGGKRLKVAFARPQCKEIQNANLYVTNIPPDYDADRIRTLFKDFGTIVECRILKDDDGKSRGVGFVRMDTHMNAIKALEERDQFKPEPDKSPLVVKLAQRRSNKRVWPNKGRRRTDKGGSTGQSMSSSQGVGGGTNDGSFFKKNNSPNRHSRGQFYRPRTMAQGKERKNPGQAQAYPGFPPVYDAAYANPPVGGFYQPVATMGTASSQQPTSASTGGGAVVSSGGGGGGLAPATSQATASGSSRNYSNTTFNIIVYHLPAHYNVDHLIQLYAPYGPIQSVNIQKPQPNNPKGQTFGVISYFYFDDAQRAQNETNGRRVGDRRLEVVFQAAK